LFDDDVVSATDYLSWIAAAAAAAAAAAVGVGVG
uniref:Uncharacterized protein n=1 Tax=Heligmosomoides polygyrus TaxID=6339 RepID=A0A183FZS5_HELPZ